ncbi:MAG: glycerophosphoryl diester phosphodiesterase [Oceanicaulis sp. HLUCCA04]|nr:MAG: glycerophosphoryl diester phosphodiesterase [Oceanicaulis sp. HLUCCA04]
MPVSDSARFLMLASPAVALLIAACSEPVGEIEIPERSEVASEAEMRLAEAVQAETSLPEPLVPAMVAEGQRTTDVLRCLRDRDATIVSAHRGGVEPGFPENAIESAANTLAQGPLILELDLRRTADGVIVLMHDETLDRTTTGTGDISQMSFADLAQFQLVDNEGEVTPYRIPSLSEVLNWARGRALVQLDVKRTVPVEEVVASIVENDAVAYSAVITYTLEDALRAAAADENVIISIEITDQERLDALQAAGVDRSRLMAWTGVHREPVPEIWDLVAAADIPVAFGALWYIDSAVLESGDTSIYREIADGGVTVIASDLHWTAYEALEERQDTVAAFQACTAR